MSCDTAKSADPAHRLLDEVVGPRDGGTVILLNGATCAGKTTVAKALQVRLDGIWLRMGVDDFNQKLRDALNVRRVEPDTLATHQRLLLGLHRAVAGVALAGNNVIVDHVLGEHWRLDDCLRVFTDLRVIFVGIRCPLPELERRERERSSRRAAAGQYPLVHADLMYDIEVDTAALSPDECADRIRAALTIEVGHTAFDRLRAHRS